MDFASPWSFWIFQTGPLEGVSLCYTANSRLLLLCVQFLSYPVTSIRVGEAPGPGAKDNLRIWALFRVPPRSYGASNTPGPPRCPHTEVSVSVRYSRSGSHYNLLNGGPGTQGTPSPTKRNTQGQKCSMIPRYSICGASWTSSWLDLFGLYRVDLICQFSSSTSCWSEWQFSCPWPWFEPLDHLPLLTIFIFPLTFSYTALPKEGNVYYNPRGCNTRWMKLRLRLSEPELLGKSLKWL